MEYLDSLGKRAKDASVRLNVLDAASKNLGLRAAAQALIKESASIIEANRLDMEEAVANGMSEALQDRLMLNEDRIKAMAEGLEQISAMKDPIGEVMENNIRPNGLKIMKVRVPMGVIGIIYESRPNVTADAFGLCFKTGNAVILRGGSDSINSNKEIVNVIRKALENEKLPGDALLLVEDTSRQTATEFMKMNDYMPL